MKTNKELKTDLLKPPPAITRPGPADYVSTGNTLLNLALTGNVDHGFAKGHYYFMVGDSESGKTFFTLTVLAEAAKLAAFDKYKFIVDFPEQGALMDFRKFFGKKMAGRVQAPHIREDKAAFSRTLEELYYTIHKYMSKGPCIYILDSMDSLQPEADIKKFKTDAAAYTAKGKDAGGSYGMAKARVNSDKIRQVATIDIKQHNSILIFISQTRDEINPISYHKSKTRSGGHALKFYATAEIWTSIAKPIYKKIGEKSYNVGQVTRAVVRKNRTSGRHQTVLCPFYMDYGFDDIGGCIDFLVEEKKWKKYKGLIDAGEIGLERCNRNQLIRAIENDDLMEDLKSATADLWLEIEAKKRIKRKPRYE